MENYSTDKFDKLCDVFFAFIYIYIPFPSFTGNMPCKRVKLQFVWLGLAGALSRRKTCTIAASKNLDLKCICAKWTTQGILRLSKWFFLRNPEPSTGLCFYDKIAFGESNCCEFGHGSKNGDWGPLWTHIFDKWLAMLGLWIWKHVFLVLTCSSHDHLKPGIRNILL